MLFTLLSLEDDEVSHVWGKALIVRLEYIILIWLRLLKQGE